MTTMVPEGKAALTEAVGLGRPILRSNNDDDDAALVVLMVVLVVVVLTLYQKS